MPLCSLVCTTSGITCSTSCAITPIEASLFSFHLYETPLNLPTVPRALLIVFISVLSVSSEKAVILPVAVKAPVTVTPVLVVSNFLLLL